MSEEADYDVVVATLQQAIDLREKIGAGNETWGVMDHIRCAQIAQLEKAIDVWKTKQRKLLDEKEINLMFNDILERSDYRDLIVNFVRALEKRYGIAGEDNG